MRGLWIRRAAESGAGRLALQLLRRWFIHDVARQAAALAYYLLFTLFPFLIFLSSLLGMLELDPSAVTAALGGVLPPEAAEMLGAYLDYVGRTSSAGMLWFGLVFSVWFPARAAGCLMDCVRRAYHLPRPKNRLRYAAKVLACTLLLLFAMALTLVLMSVGRRALEVLALLLRLPVGLARIWNVLRFGLMALVAFGAVGFLYAAAQDRRGSGGTIVPGAVAALLGWLTISAAYAFYVENFGNYSVIYGALGAVIVLLVWLYLTAAALIMGAEMNSVLLPGGAAGGGGEKLYGKEKRV